jgi:spore germination cell wall hydrolase CwlJ-like protein
VWKCPIIFTKKVTQLNPKKLTGYAMLFLISTYSMVLPAWTLFSIPAAPVKSKGIAKIEKQVKQNPNQPVHERLSEKVTPLQPALSPSSAVTKDSGQPKQVNTGQTVPSAVKPLPVAVSPTPAKPVVSAWKPAVKPARANVNGSTSAISDYQFRMLARIISAEAKGEPLTGQVAVGAVILNRVRSGRFPDNIAANVLKRGQFEPVANGHIWNEPAPSAYKAARLALQGWDPTRGALYFFNPAKSTSRWIWSRPVIMRIGDHVFAS